jgi:hypothetical protein
LAFHIEGGTKHIHYNRVLRKIFGPKEEKIIGRCRKLYKEKLHDLYSLSNITRVMKLRIMTHSEGKEVRTELWCLNLMR